MSSSVRCSSRFTRLSYRTATRTLSRPQLSSRVPRACSGLPSNRLLANVHVADSDRCATVKLKWYRQAGSKEEHYYSTELQGAHLVDLRTYIPNVFDPKNSEFQHMEECAFAYQKIIWTHETEGKQAEDDWLAPVE